MKGTISQCAGFFSFWPCSPSVRRRRCLWPRPRQRPRPPRPSPSSTRTWTPSTHGPRRFPGQRALHRRRKEPLGRGATTRSAVVGRHGPQRRRPHRRFARGQRAHLLAPGGPGTPRTSSPALPFRPGGTATLTVTNQDTDETDTPPRSCMPRPTQPDKRITKSRNGTDTSARSHTRSCYLNNLFGSLYIDCWGGREAVARYGFTLPRTPSTCRGAWWQPWLLRPRASDQDRFPTSRDALRRPVGSPTGPRTRWTARVTYTTKVGADQEPWT